MPWLAVPGPHGYRYVGRLCGHVMTVHGSTSIPGQFYPVVDGHHLSAMGGPTTYGDMYAAMEAAEAAVTAVLD